MDATQLGLFERACAELQTGDTAARQAAEQMLMQMRTSEHAVAVAAGAVQAAASSGAKFQAALILRDAALRDWVRMSKPERVHVRDELLNYTLTNHGSLEGFVTRQLLQVAALLVKRGWLDDAPPAAPVRGDAADSASGHAMASREARLAALEGGSATAAVFDRLPALLGSGDLESQHVAGQLLLTLSDEFSFTRASAVGLAWEEHARARTGFEMITLQRIFSLSLDVLEQHSAVAAQCGGGPRYEEWLSTWLGVLNVVLSWDFATASDSEAVLAGMASNLKKGDADSADVIWLQPGENWRTALTDGRLVALLFALAEATAPVRQLEGGGLIQGIQNPALSKSARVALLSLSNLEGTVFADRSSRSAFYNGFLGLTLGWLESAVNSAQQLVAQDGDADQQCDAARVVLDGLSVLERLFHNLAKYREVLFVAWDAGAASGGGGPVGAPELCRLLAQLEKIAAFALAPFGDGSDGSNMDALLERAESCAGARIAISHYTIELLKLLLMAFCPVCLAEWRDELVLKTLQCWGKLVPQMGVQPSASAAREPCYATAEAALRGSTAGLVDRLIRWRVCRASLLEGLRWSKGHEGDLSRSSFDRSDRVSGDEESESELAARIGRLVLGHTLGLICEMLSGQLAMLREAATAVGSDGARRRAEGAVGCLVEMATALLTHDGGVGGTLGFGPCRLPDAVVTLSLEAEQRDTGCPIASTLQTLHEGAGLLNYLLRQRHAGVAPGSPASATPPPASPAKQGGGTPFLMRNLPPQAREGGGGSPRTPRAPEQQIVSDSLIAVVLNALGKVCSSYLSLSDPRNALLYPRGLGSQLQRACSCNQGGGGQAVVVLYVGLASQALQCATAPNVEAKRGSTVAETAAALLLRLAQQHVARPHLLACDAWLGLAQAYAAGGGVLGSHSGRVKRSLGGALATAGLTAEPAEGYLLALRGALVTPLFSLATDGLGAAISAQGAPATIEALCHFLHGLQGVAGAEAHSTHTAVVLNVLGLLDVLPLLALVIEGCAQAAPGKPAIDVLVASVKLLATLVDAHGDDLGEIEQPACAAVYDATNACLQVVGRVASAMVTAVGSSGNVAGALHARYRVVRGLLKVATVFWPRAIIGEEEAVAELLFRLVSVLLPCVDTELLQIPSVCHGYFELWQFLVDLYPGRVATLPPALFASLIQSLEWGLATDVEAEVTQRVCLQTMAAMAEHAFKALQDSRGNSGAEAEVLLGSGTQVRVQVMYSLHSSIIPFLSPRLHRCRTAPLYSRFLMVSSRSCFSESQ